MGMNVSNEYGDVVLSWSIKVVTSNQAGLWALKTDS